MDTPEILRTALDYGYLHTIDDKSVQEESISAFFYDLDEYNQTLENLRNAFPTNFLHACAIKSNPLKFFLDHRSSIGFGAECASIEEVHLALQSNFPENKIVFDSPCKTFSDLYFCLSNKIHVNMDNYEEVERVRHCLQVLKERDPDFEPGTIGLRINPLIGSGTIEQLSVSTVKSKFGVLFSSSIQSDEVITASQKAVNVCAENKFITGVHVHCGSGGMELEQLVKGVKVAVNFVAEVNKQREAHEQIKILDIGGGIGVNFSQKLSKGRAGRGHNVYEVYATQLKEHVPQLFDPKVFSQVVTEFGASVNMNSGWFISRVEYVKKVLEEKDHTFVYLHAASDMFMRQCYAREQFNKNRMFVLPNQGKEEAVEFHRNLDQKSRHQPTFDFVGPLCFAGDVLMKDMIGTKDIEVKENDFVVVQDCGANALSLRNMHCSRRMPAVYGYKRDPRSGKIRLQVIKQKESLATLMGNWK